MIAVTVTGRNRTQSKKGEDQMSKNVIIIGGSAAGITAGITVRRNYPDAAITLIRKEEQVLIPCGIPYIFGTVGVPQKNLIPDALLENNRINLIIDEATSIDREKKVVTTKSHSEAPYDKLILATGSLPLELPLKGREKENVYMVMKDVDYLQKLSDRMETAKDLVIIGGGFIGVEFADECKKRNENMNVTVVELLPHCLLLACDEEFCVEAEKKLVERGITILPDARAEEIVGKGKVEAVRLSNGKEIKADVVIMGVGVVPNIELAESAGLKIGATKAIHVDQYMRTSDKDIFACGDCCEKFSFFDMKPSRLRLASIATTEARIAGANLFELKQKNDGVIGVFATVVNGLTVGTAGLTQSAAIKAGFDTVAEIASGPDRHPGGMPGMSNLNVKLVFDKKSGRILGGQVWGGSSGGELLNAIAAQITAGMKADDIARFQIGTHPALTASPIAYHLVNAAEKAMNLIQKPNILIVEDDRDFVGALMAVLSSQPYSLDVAHTKDEAMAKIAKNKPSLVLLDIMLDRVDDGFTICRELKSDPQYWDIPIIAMSAISRDADLDPGIGDHFKVDEFLAKPVKAKDLLEKIKQFI